MDLELHFTQILSSRNGNIGHEMSPQARLNGMSIYHAVITRIKCCVMYHACHIKVPRSANEIFSEHLMQALS